MKLKERDPESETFGNCTGHTYLQLHLHPKKRQSEDKTFDEIITFMKYPLF